jgi:hypothetical protein
MAVVHNYAGVQTIVSVPMYSDSRVLGVEARQAIEGVHHMLVDRRQPVPRRGRRMDTDNLGANHASRR